MHLKEPILTESHYERKVIKKSFFKKIQVTITTAIILGFLIVGSLIYLRQHLDFKHQLESQGKVLAANLAFNSEQFIVEYNKNQLNELLDGVLKNSYVLFGGIINSRITDPVIDVLKKQPFIDLEFVTELIRYPSYSNISEAESITIKSDRSIGEVIFCVSPIFSDLQFPDDESTLLYGQEKIVSIIGYSVIGYKLPWNEILSVQFKWFFVIYLFASIGLGWAIGRILTNYWTRRLKRIHKALSEYSFGEIVSIQDPIKDEVSIISESLSGLTEMVNIQLNKIQILNKDLDNKVIDRTKELTSLKDEMIRQGNFQRTFTAQIIQELKVLLSIVKELENKEKAVFNVDYFYGHIDQLIDLVIQIIRRKNELRLPLKLHEISINQVIRELEPIFKILANRQSNQLVINIEKDLKIFSDELQLVQSILQVVSNACKYTENGIVEVNINKKEKIIVFEFIDNGIGMDQSHVDRVFTNLSRFNLEEINTFSNLGLGLLLVYQFVHNIGGNLRCNSEKGVGTSIILEHPIEGIKPVVELAHQIICFSDSIEMVRDLSLLVHEIGWEVIHIKSIKNCNYYETNFIILDLDSIQNVKSYIDKISKIKHNSLFILVSNKKAIICHNVLVKKDLKNIHETINKFFLKDNEVGILLEGFSKSENELISNNITEKRNIFTRFSIRDQIDFRIVSEEKYRTLYDMKPLILILENLKSLNEFINSKGTDLDDVLSKLINNN